MQLGKFMTAALTMVLAAQLYGQQVTFEDVMARYNWDNKDRYMYTVWVKLTMNDSLRQLTINSKQRPLNVKYEDIREVILDPNLHDIYLEYRRADGGGQPYMLWVEPDVWDKVVEKVNGAFRDRVTVTEPLVGAKIEKSALKDTRSSFSLTVDKKNRPMGAIKPDKALVVLVCLPFHYRATGVGKEMKLHANDSVIAVYKMGTYVFAYLDPGEYVLASEADISSALKVKVEAGKDYYFLQRTWVGFRKYTAELAMHSKQVVLYELDGAFYSDWKRKK